MLKRLAIRAGLSLLGVAIMLGYWRLRSHDTREQHSDHVPEKVWDGGGALVTLVAEASAPAKLRAVFETSNEITDPNHHLLETWQSLPAGKHTFSIDVPANTQGSVEVQIEQPEVGATASVVVQVETRVIAHDQQTLDEPLKPGYAFAAMVELDDWISESAEE